MHDERDKVDSRARAEFVERNSSKNRGSGRGGGRKEEAKARRRTFPPSGRLAIIKEVYSYEMHAS